LDSAIPASLLEVRGLRTHFYTDEGIAPAVDGIDLDILPGQTLGLVGESGCGKSVTGLSLLRLVAPPGRIVGGEIRMRGQNLLDLSAKEMRKLRGEQIAMIFQEPMTSLDPLYPVRDPLLETLRIHRKMSKREARAKAIELLTSVGITDAERRVDSYPHELSGGMRQRVMIASAIACDPSVLIADEPTTALEAENGMAILLITHNLGIVAENCHQVAVMYAGKIVERGPMRMLFRNPRHPYTQGLLRAVPRLDHPVKQPLPTIPGSVPNLLHLPSGCRFRSRCAWAQAKCAEEEPPLQEVEGGHTAACWVLPAFTQPVPVREGETV